MTGERFPWIAGDLQIDPEANRRGVGGPGRDRREVQDLLADVLEGRCVDRGRRFDSRKELGAYLGSLGLLAHPLVGLAGIDGTGRGADLLITTGLRERGPETDLRGILEGLAVGVREQFFEAPQRGFGTPVPEGLVAELEEEFLRRARPDETPT